LLCELVFYRLSIMLSALGTKLTSSRLITRRGSGGNYALPCNPTPRRRNGDLFQRARRCIGTGGDSDNATGLACYVRTFDPCHFNRHQLHDVVQLAGGGLSNRLFRSSAASCPGRLWPLQRTLYKPYLERDGEHDLQIKLHLDLAVVSDCLRPTSLHIGTIAGVVCGEVIICSPLVCRSSLPRCLDNHFGQRPIPLYQDAKPPIGPNLFQLEHIPYPA
jgi:hypothetical protein